MRDGSLVLIVDDERYGRETLEMLLAGQGYELAFARDGKEALSRVAELEPDLILQDVMMPGMDGFEVCQRLKADDRFRSIPIILVTALDTKEDLVRGLEAGADEFLSKPVSRIELRARVRSMLRIKKQYDELQAALRLREDMANMIVHDMRSPLTTIVGHGEAVVRHLHDEELRRNLDVILAEARRLSSFANDMLMLAKLQAGKLIVNRSEVDIRELIWTIEESHDVVARSRDIKLVVETPDEPRYVSVDENLFERVLDNLISNALKFSPSGTTVVMSVEYLDPPVNGHGLRIQVIDEGPGIPEEARDRIFRQYEIVDMRQRGVGQVGLGLAFAKLVVDAHDGAISVSPNTPVGSVFRVEI